MMDRRFAAAALQPLSDAELHQLHKAVLDRLALRQEQLGKAQEARSLLMLTDDVLPAALQQEFDGIKTELKVSRKRARDLSERLAALRWFQFRRRKRAEREQLAHEQAMRELNAMWDKTVEQIRAWHRAQEDQAEAVMQVAMERVNLGTAAAESCVAETRRREAAGKPPSESQGRQPDPAPDRKPSGGSGQQHRPPSEVDGAANDDVNDDGDDGDADQAVRHRG